MHHRVSKHGVLLDLRGDLGGGLLINYSLQVFNLRMIRRCHHSHLLELTISLHHHACTSPFRLLRILSHHQNIPPFFLRSRHSPGLRIEGGSVPLVNLLGALAC